MNCNLPKSWHQLPQSEKDKIYQAMTEEAYKIADRQTAETQEIWIKLACMLLRKSFDFNEEKLLQFVAAWNIFYQRNERVQTKEEQAAWLASEMETCFPECGFPQDRIDNLKNK